VEDPVVTATTALALFAGTNIDDVIVLTVLFLTNRTSGRPRVWQIWAGQYLGFALLVAVAVAMAAGLTIVPDDRVGLLGVVPLGLGIVGLVRAVRDRRGGEQRAPTVAVGLAAVVAVTVANGADNLAVYAPLFRTIGVASSVATIAVFAGLVALWCLAARWLGSRPPIVTMIERYGDWLVPFVFMAIGLAIIVEAA
jgi:cadmium resistance protein CadD (predicted permease)